MSGNTSTSGKKEIPVDRYAEIDEDVRTWASKDKNGTIVGDGNTTIIVACGLPYFKDRIAEKTGETSTTTSSNDGTATVMDNSGAFEFDHLMGPGAYIITFNPEVIRAKADTERKAKTAKKDSKDVGKEIDD